MIIYLFILLEREICLSLNKKASNSKYIQILETIFFQGRIVEVTS